MSSMVQNRKPLQRYMEMFGYSLKRNFATAQAENVALLLRTKINFGIALSNTLKKWGNNFDCACIFRYQRCLSLFFPHDIFAPFFVRNKFAFHLAHQLSLAGENAQKLRLQLYFSTVFLPGNLSQTTKNTSVGEDCHSQICAPVFMHQITDAFQMHRSLRLRVFFSQRKWKVVVKKYGYTI